ncbi:RNA 2',3'-cyclic phosphodiesterase [Streptomyces peucetius]|uniref:RNA 2',3'-cyclic phosphodiesterase n=1 Tax=Streptomyces peucetius TaxID=1950 RepID=A0ABY6IA53_STRPE|nr:RNA 2',3'-cyclic phosphodiesterase [Streptomyces peucetius]UYQ62842.1 RNA 2',3'-cyclic phosphodiesterase [Streptomyces peucetius]
MRLFAAVLPTPTAVDELATEVAALKRLPDADSLRWTGHAGWHFTLAFMGEIGDEFVPDLRARLARAAHRTAPFPLRLHRGGRFGNRALWVGAAGGIEQMRLLAERADAAARRAGVEMEEHRRYQAHLTIARARLAADLRPYVDALDGFEGTAWEVGQLALVRSNLPVSGVQGEQPRYEVAGSWPLGGAG